MSEVRPMRRCDACGQVDDHPMHRYAAPGRVFLHHHDCIPSWIVDDLTHETFYGIDGSGNPYVTDRVPLTDLHPANARALEIRKKAQSGTHGPELLSYIASMDHTDGNEG